MYSLSKRHLPLFHRYHRCGPLYVYFIFHQHTVIALDPESVKVRHWILLTCVELSLLLKDFNPSVFLSSLNKYMDPDMDIHVAVCRN